MTRDELVNRLKQITNRESGDTEADYSDADAALLDYIDDDEVRELYESIEGWYA